jgi:hypothetical protein
MRKTIDLPVGTWCIEHRRASPLGFWLLQPCELPLVKPGAQAGCILRHAFGAPMESATKKRGTR